MYRQYDHMVRTNTLVLPGMAGVVRGEGNRARAGVVGRRQRSYCSSIRIETILAVVEAARNVACAGGEPIGATIAELRKSLAAEMYVAVWEGLEGITAACQALDIPSRAETSAFTTKPTGNAIYPTPVLGVVGLIEEARKFGGEASRRADAIVLLGQSRHELGGARI